MASRFTQLSAGVASDNGCGSLLLAGHLCRSEGQRRRCVGRLKAVGTPKSERCCVVRSAQVSVKNACDLTVERRIVWMVTIKRQGDKPMSNLSARMARGHVLFSSSVSAFPVVYWFLNSKHAELEMIV